MNKNLIGRFLDPRHLFFSKDHFIRKHGQLGNRVFFSWTKAFMSLMPLGGASAGNRVTLYSEGDAAFFSIQEAIRGAQKNIWLETYIFEPDVLGTRIRNALIDAALRGVHVVVLYDHMGSSKITQSFWKPLRAAGGKMHAFNPIWPWRRHGPFLFRDHRKILIIDNLFGFCGGHNMSADYAGPKLGNNKFRDTMIRLEGPSVTDLGQIFWSSLRETTGEKRKLIYDGPAYNPGVFSQVLGSNTRRNLYAIQKSMKVTLKRSTRYCYFTTPYFLPYDGLRKAILEAASRGVDVRILTAGLSDVPLMKMASQCVYGQFLKAGIRVYEMFDKILHAKTVTIDGVYGSVGSYNLDHWSARRNLEVNVSVFDAKVAGDLEKQFQEDLLLSREVTMAELDKRPWWMRVTQWLAYQLMRL
jgi:cardiolipin synthase A/B